MMPITKCSHFNRLMQDGANNDVALLIGGETTCEGQRLLLGLYDYDADEMSGGDENEKYGI